MGVRRWSRGCPRWLLATAMVASCGDDTPAREDAPAVDAAIEAATTATAQAPAVSEVERRRQALIGWHRCLHTVRDRAQLDWGRYELAFKPETGRPRSRDIQPYFENVAEPRSRCVAADGATSSLPEAVRSAGAAFLREADALAKTIKALQDASVVDDDDKGTFAGVAEAGPAFGSQLEAFEASAAALQSALAPARAGVEVEWLEELQAKGPKGLPWRVATAGVAARSLEACAGALPGTEPCTEALRTFDAAAEDLESYLKANPDARLGAFWLDVVRAKLPDLRKVAQEAHARKRPKIERFRAADDERHRASVRAAIVDTTIAVDRVRFDFP